MDFLLGFLLIVMGLIVAQEFITRRVPALRALIDTVQPFAEYIGFAGMLLGILWVFRSLGMLRYLFTSHLLIVLWTWAVSALLLILGLILGLSLLHSLLQPSPPFLLTLDKWREKLLAYSKELGLAAIIVGLIGMF